MDRGRVTTWLDEKRKKLVGTLPTIVFFIALFWLVSLAFGDTYLLVVSPYTTLFEVRFGKYNPPGQYARFFLVSAFALVAARLAVANPVLCVLVNLAMPFALVYMRSSQLNPRRYFPYTMLFAFLELRPENLIETFAAQAAVLAASCGLLSAVLLVSGLIAHYGRQARAELHANVQRLADDLDRIADGGVGPILSQELLQVRREMAELAYTAREDSSAPVRVTNLLDMLATLAQRTAYLTGNLDWTARNASQHADCLRELASLTRELDLAIADGGDAEKCRSLLPKAHELLANTHLEEDRFRIFFQSYLNMAVLILRTASDPYQRVWHLSPAGRARVALFRKRPTLDSFEMRFSLRCGAVLAVSCLANLLFPVDHLYWYVLHAFLLLQPFPDESSRRMRTRMIGTAIGCVFVHAVALLNLDAVGITILGMILIAPLYASTPGSVTSAFFATAYAVSMASVSIDDAYATSMRLASLVLAIITVALVNRLICPTSDRRLFVANMRQMLDMVRRSWELVRTTLDERVDTVVSSETLLHFQMVHSQAAGFVEELASAGEKNREIAALAQYHNAAERMLFCLWALMCELEQLELLVRLREVREDERKTFETIIDLAEANCEPERFGTNVDAAEELLFKLSGPDLRYVLQQYVDRAGELRLAIDDARGALVERPSYLDEIRHVG